MNILKLLKKIKKTQFWYYILKFIIKPTYDFIWLNIINIHGRILYFLWFSRNKKSTLLKNNDKVILDKVEDVQKIIEEVNKVLTSNIVNKAIKNIENDNLSENIANSGENTYKVEINDILEDETKKIISDFCLSEKIISIVSSYLGVFPILNNITLYLNIPRKQEDQRGSMNWHRDDFGYRSMDLFIPITNIDDKNGPLYVVKKKENLGRFVNYQNEIKNALPGNRGKILDKDFKILSNNKDEILTLHGEKGKILFIDSFNSYHKGGHCFVNYRIMLRITYSTVDTYITNEEYYKNNINEVRKFAEKNKFYNFMLNKKSEFIFKFKIYKFLVKFYRFLSFSS